MNVWLGALRSERARHVRVLCHRTPFSMLRLDRHYTARWQCDHNKAHLESLT